MALTDRSITNNCWSKRRQRLLLIRILMKMTCMRSSNRIRWGSIFRSTWSGWLKRTGRCLKLGKGMWSSGPWRWIRLRSWRFNWWKGRVWDKKRGTFSFPTSWWMLSAHYIAQLLTGQNTKKSFLLWKRRIWKACLFVIGYWEWTLVWSISLKNLCIWE